MSLEQYYTEESIGERLVSMLPDVYPVHCVELSAGQGGLLRPVIRLWPDVSVTTCELDPVNVGVLVRDFEGHHYNIDVLSESFESVFFNRFSTFDLAISNPPFSWRKVGLYDTFLLELFGLRKIFGKTRIRAEVLFILQYVRLAADSAYMAFILPELIVCSASLSKFRSALLDFCSVVSVAEIDSGAFRGTEAKTYILILRKDRDVREFQYTDRHGLSSVKVPKDFIIGLQDLGALAFTPIADDRFLIRRGKFSSKECKFLGLPYYHTSGFFQGTKGVSTMPFKSSVLLGRGALTAVKGDILIHRVGSRVLGRAVLVEEGEFLVSDCIFRVRFNVSIDLEGFLRYWNDECYERVIRNSRGTCAKYFTAQDLALYLSEFLSVINHDYRSALVR